LSLEPGRETVVEGVAEKPARETPYFVKMLMKALSPAAYSVKPR